MHVLKCDRCKGYIVKDGEEYKVIVHRIKGQHSRDSEIICIKCWECRGAKRIPNHLKNITGVYDYSSKGARQ